MFYAFINLIRLSFLLNADAGNVSHLIDAKGNYKYYNCKETCVFSMFSVYPYLKNIFIDVISDTLNERYYCE